MTVSEFLALRDVLPAVKAADKDALLHRLAQQAAGELELAPDAVAGALIAREKLGSTGTGEGIALPHARMRQVMRPLGVFARMTRPVLFDALDGKPVDLVFGLLLPAGQDARHLSVLAAAARRLRDPATQARLRQAASQAELHAILCAQR